MLFNYQTFISELRQNEDKKEIITKYESFFGEIKGEIKDQLWYKDYVSKFRPFSYATPNIFCKEFDWDLLCQLTASSSNPNGFFKLEKGKIEFLINLKTDTGIVQELVTELSNRQISAIFEFYCEEQMNLQILMMEDGRKFEKEKEKNEKKSIESEKQQALKRWNNELESIPIKEYVNAIELDILASLE